MDFMYLTISTPVVVTFLRLCWFSGNIWEEFELWPGMLPPNNNNNNNNNNLAFFLFFGFCLNKTTLMPPVY